MPALAYQSLTPLADANIDICLKIRLYYEYLHLQRARIAQ